MISVVLKLAKHDVVKVVIDSGKLYDSESLHYTHFSGYLIKEEVAFSAYRDSDLIGNTYSKGAITYDGAYINSGNGLNLVSGKFKAPVTGTYAFHFNSLNEDTSRHNSDSEIQLFHKKSLVTRVSRNRNSVLFEYVLNTSCSKRLHKKRVS